MRFDLIWNKLKGEGTVFEIERLELAIAECDSGESGRVVGAAVFIGCASPSPTEKLMGVSLPNRQK